MRLTSLELIHIRSYKQEKWDFEPRIVVLYGNNGAGKTNLLESIYVGTIGKSHRTSDLKDILQWNEQEAGIIIHFEKRETPHTIHIQMSDKGRKIIKLNQNKVSQKELIGTLNTVIFSPEDLDLIKGNPSMRRRFLDIEISQTSPHYYHQLHLYERAIKQRNRILKEYAHASYAPTDEWDMQIATIGEYIIKKRLETLKKLNVLMDLMNRKLTEGKEDLRLHYTQPYSEEKILITKEELWDQLKKKLPIDRKRLLTSVGPHRDDILFFSGLIDLKRFGSQGQQRTAVLSLKLSELEYIKSEVGEYPILLLDDVLSELDAQRRQNLLKFIHKRIQTFITTTDIHDVKALDGVQYIQIGGDA